MKCFHKLSSILYVVRNLVVIFDASFMSYFDFLIIPCN